MTKDAMKATSIEDGYWISSRGPLGPGQSGIELHYIQDAEQWHNYLRANAEDDRRRDRIDRMSSRYEPGHLYTPSIDWWDSLDAYNRGQKGFSGWTKDRVEREFPNFVIHQSGEEAKEAHRRKHA